MKYSYKEMLSAARSAGLANEKTMWRSVDSLDEMLCVLKEEHPDMFWDFMREQHEAFYGQHFDEMFALWQVSQMYHKTADGKECKGEHWSVENATEVYSKHKSKLPADTTVFDVYVALNGNWHDKAELFKKWDAEEFEQMIIEDAICFYFMDCDWKSDGKVWDYMNAND